METVSRTPPSSPSPQNGVRWVPRRSFSASACSWTFSMATAACTANAVRASALADRDPIGRVSMGQAVGGLADQGGAVGGEQQQAARLGPPGLDGRLQHHRQQLGQVVGRGQGLAEAVHGAGQLVAAGAQGGQLLAQLDPHALEGPGQLAHLAAGADGRRGRVKSPLAMARAWAASSPRGRLTSSRARSRGSLVSGWIDMTTWRPASRPRWVPSVAGTPSSAVRRPMVLATNRRTTGASGPRLVHDGLEGSSPAGSSARATMRSQGIAPCLVTADRRSASPALYANVSNTHPTPSAGSASNSSPNSPHPSSFRPRRLQPSRLRRSRRPRTADRTRPGRRPPNPRGRPWPNSTPSCPSPPRPGPRTPHRPRPLPHRLGRSPRLRPRLLRRPSPRRRLLRYRPPRRRRRRQPPRRSRGLLLRRLPRRLPRPGGRPGPPGPPRRR
jgi:hypothetical protein